jgi:hypothetical protein
MKLFKVWHLSVIMNLSELNEKKRQSDEEEEKERY